MDAFRIALLLVGAAFAGEAAAQAAHKCVDGKARVTYTDNACEKLGLRPAGAIQDRLSIIGPAGSSVKAPAPAVAPAMPAAKAVPPATLASAGEISWSTARLQPASAAAPSLYKALTPIVSQRYTTAPR